MSEPLMPQHDPPIALTMGDPAGIGPEITLKCWLQRNQATCPPFLFLGSAELLETCARSLEVEVPIHRLQEPVQARDVFPDALPVLDLPLPAPCRPGVPDSRNAPMVIRSIDLAYDLVRTGQASALVTNPIHKNSLYSSGFSQPGHTEYLAQLCGLDFRPVMMLASERLRVVPVTVHVPLREIPSRLTREGIVHAAEITYLALQRDFDIPAPRLAMAGLNPHAGEAGSMGREEIDLLLPAVRDLQAKGMPIDEPRAADSLFHETARGRYDAVLCMYHDQALIPIKTLDFDKAVNVTLGLPVVRTSPDHGTAFNIAGQNQANPSSLRAALDLAARMARARTADIHSS
ncbi:4-hydroxythreonine-4-phosphate dehydrogenase PdxA [Fodinicurvata halophila]|uniref:4-hydroxythreonine-4-phosphate dehydrogenase n=1 Tax=Fodinicurvata halophila TaxID=1419723 RepID=A0ABV8UKR3_9PROT